MEVDQAKDPKSMSLDALIKLDKKKGGNKPANKPKGGPKSDRSGKGGKGPQGGRPRFENTQKGGKDNLFRAKKTGNMISKQNERSNFNQKKQWNKEQSRPGKDIQNRRNLKTADGRGRPGNGFRARGGAAQQLVRGERGGLARRQRQVLAVPKKGNAQRTLRIGGNADKKQSFTKTKTLRPSETRLKVRNIDEKQVTNDDLKKLFAKQGELKVCRFDRNEFGQFLGSATVTYEKPADAQQAIAEYHGAFLDDKVLTVEFDMVPQLTKVVRPPSAVSNQPNSARGSSGVLKVRKGPNAGNQGKTLRINKN